MAVQTVKRLCLAKRVTKPVETLVPKAGRIFKQAVGSIAALRLPCGLPSASCLSCASAASTTGQSALPNIVSDESFEAADDVRLSRNADSLVFLFAAFEKDQGRDALDSELG